MVSENIVPKKMSNCQLNEMRNHDGAGAAEEGRGIAAHNSLNTGVIDCRELTLLAEKKYSRIKYFVPKQAAKYNNNVL